MHNLRIKRSQPLRAVLTLLFIVKTTICGTDLHIIKGDTPEVKSHTTLGHEGIGIIEEIVTTLTTSKLEIK